MIQLLREHPLLLLFVVAALGYLIGNIRVRGSSLGVAAVLFTGLIIGALDPELYIPETILLLGLAIYVYSVGLSSGPAFFDAFRARRIKELSFILTALLFSGVLAIVLWYVFDFSAALIAGIYSGSTTNTAALAGVIDLIGSAYEGADSMHVVARSVVGYSFSYPMGVLSSIIAIVALEKMLNIDYEKEKEVLSKQYAISEELTSATLEVTRLECCGIQLRDLYKDYDWNVVFGRIMKDGDISLSSWNTSFELHDLIMVVGSEADISRVAEALGQKTTSSLAYDREHFDVRSIFVSNPEVAGRTLASLNLDEKYNAIITRVRRGDMNILAQGDTTLELGDRIRFIARKDDLKALSIFFGDSYQESSKIDLFSFGLGIGLGLILGITEFSLGGDFKLKLGYAGGPLIVGLILGALRRTGPISWTLSYSANITLQQVGLIFLLAAIGVRSGTAFVQSLSSEGFEIFAAGASISLLTAFMVLLLGYLWLKIPFTLLMGMVSNQPAILEFAKSRANSRIPEIGFTLMFPIALIIKILIAQVLYVILS